MELATGILDKYGLAVLVVLALGWAFWKLGGRAILALESFLTNTTTEMRTARTEFVGELRAHREEEAGNHREALAEIADFRRAMLERDQGDEDDDLTPVGGIPRRRISAANGQRRK